MVSINIFDVDDIELGQVSKLKCGGYSRHITIRDLKRNKTEISLFGENVRDLILRNE